MNKATYQLASAALAKQLDESRQRLENALNNDDSSHFITWRNDTTYRRTEHNNRVTEDVVDAYAQYLLKEVVKLREMAIASEEMKKEAIRQ